MTRSGWPGPGSWAANSGSVPTRSIGARGYPPDRRARGPLGTLVGRGRALRFEQTGRETVRWRGGWARLGPWRGHPDIGHVVIGAVGPCDPGRGRRLPRAAPRARLRGGRHQRADAQATPSRSSTPDSRCANGCTSSSTSAARYPAPTRPCPRPRRARRADRAEVLALDARCVPAVLAARVGGPRRRHRRDADRALPGRRRPTAGAGRRSPATRSPAAPGATATCSGSPSTRRRARLGYGRALVGDALRWLRRHDVRRTLVNTQLDNHRAVVLYESCGFRRAARRAVRARSHVVRPVCGRVAVALAVLAVRRRPWPLARPRAPPARPADPVQAPSTAPATVVDRPGIHSSSSPARTRGRRSAARSRSGSRLGPPRSLPASDSIAITAALETSPSRTAFANSFAASGSQLGSSLGGRDDPAVVAAPGLDRQRLARRSASQDPTAAAATPAGSPLRADGRLPASRSSSATRPTARIEGTRLRDARRRGRRGRLPAHGARREPLAGRVGVAAAHRPVAPPRRLARPQGRRRLEPDGRLGRQVAALGRAPGRAADPRARRPRRSRRGRTAAKTRSRRSRLGVPTVQDALGPTQVIDGPYVPIDIPSLLDHDLSGAVDTELSRGDGGARTTFFGTRIDTDTAFARPRRAGRRSSRLRSRQRRPRASSTRARSRRPSRTRVHAAPIRS